MLAGAKKETWKIKMAGAKITAPSKKVLTTLPALGI